jgi:pyruvate-formate lyase-activating enzyme
MILFIEPISKNIDLYVPAYPLPLLEIASFVSSHLPRVDIGVISVPVDYGLPITPQGKAQIHEELIKDILSYKPKAVGISCTAIAQAEETIQICELIKASNPEIITFLGGYFPTLYYEEIFMRSSAVDIIVTGEGEEPALRIIESLVAGKSPFDHDIPNLVWKENNHLNRTRNGIAFDLRRKRFLDLKLLKSQKSYEILPYAFSRGCPYHCSFCMEEYIRPIRREVPHDIVRGDLSNLVRQSKAHTLLISDALFMSFKLLPMLRMLGMRINFETRCDVINPEIVSEIADVCGILALGFESASYETLKRMNKINDKSHYERYISSTVEVFQEAVRRDIPVVVFMIAGYPGDTEEDLKRSLEFVQSLAKEKGSGGYVFKIGECRVYPKTKLHEFASGMPDTIVEDNGVFGENIVRMPSKHLNFETVLSYMTQIFNLSHSTPKLQDAITKTMPLFRIPAMGLADRMLPDICFKDKNRGILKAHGENLSRIRKFVPALREKYQEWLPGTRQIRALKV